MRSVTTAAFAAAILVVEGKVETVRESTEDEEFVTTSMSCWNLGSNQDSGHGGSKRRECSRSDWYCTAADVAEFAKPRIARGRR